MNLEHALAIAIVIVFKGAYRYCRAACPIRQISKLY